MTTAQNALIDRLRDLVAVAAVAGSAELELDERVIHEDLENELEVSFSESVPQAVKIRLDALLIEGLRS